MYINEDEHIVQAHKHAYLTLKLARKVICCLFETNTTVKKAIKHSILVVRISKIMTHSCLHLLFLFSIILYFCHLGASTSSSKAIC